MLLTDKPPEHLRNNPDRLGVLRKFANGISGFLGCPVYLVGGALQDFNAQPRDWDIRVWMPDEEFERRWGSVGEWCQEGLTGQWTEVRWGWARDNVKLCKDGWNSTRLNLDLQVYAATHWHAYYGRPAFRLDNNPHCPVPSAQPQGESSMGTPASTEAIETAASAPATESTTAPETAPTEAPAAPAVEEDPFKFHHVSLVQGEPTIRRCKLANLGARPPKAHAEFQDGTREHTDLALIAPSARDAVEAFIDAQNAGIAMRTELVAKAVRLNTPEEEEETPEPAPASEA